MQQTGKLSKITIETEGREPMVLHCRNLNVHKSLDIHYDDEAAVAENRHIDIKDCRKGSTHIVIHGFEDQTILP